MDPNYNDKLKQEHLEAFDLEEQKNIEASRSKRAYKRAKNQKAKFKIGSYTFRSGKR